MSLAAQCLDLGVEALAEQVRAGRLKAPEVARAFCDRVESINPSLNALIGYEREAVLAEADAVDRRIARGEVLALAGVPVTVKDNIWVSGRRITQGSRLFEDFVAPRDAWAVARLRERGAVVLGITNCSEFACKGVTTNPVYGVTHHPEDGRLTPGGSSGGAASATAAGLGLAALGTDAGGSIRRPAAHCGVVGLKPSSGLVPHPWGFAEPNFGISVVGVLARSAADCVAVFRELVAFDGGDPAGAPIAFDFGDWKAPLPAGLKFAWSPQLGCGFPVDADVMAQFEAVISRLQAGGLSVARADPEWPEGTSTYPLLALQHAGLHALYGARSAAERAMIDPDLNAQIDEGARVDGRTIADTVRRREPIVRALQRFFDAHDLLIAPAAPVTAWPWNTLPKQIGGTPVGPRGHAAFTPLFNYCGVPACTVPAGRVRDLPVGLQIVGRRFDDALVMRAVSAVERILSADARR
ncbi:MAG: amidase [Betaproteobacteria bacterium]